MKMDREEMEEKKNTDKNVVFNIQVKQGHK
jgi:hypothetical protein